MQLGYAKTIRHWLNTLIDKGMLTMAINKDTKFVISEIVKLLKSVLPTFFAFLLGTGFGGTIVYHNIQYVYNGESLSKDEVAQYLYDYGELQASHSELETQLNKILSYIKEK